MSYLQLTIQADEQEQELLISELSDVPATGFEQLPHQLIAYFNKPDFNEKEIKSLLGNFSYAVNEIEEQNWNQLWEANFQPVIIDDFCAVRAHFHAPVPYVQHEIIITPKMSFGTGHHATTYMMIQQMKNLDFAGKKVFDFGTGTGLLAILAEKLGAASVTAIDNDEWSITNASENIERNGRDHIRLQLSSTVPENEEYDVVLANINKNVILDHLASLYKTVLPKGKILFSGLLADDETAIVNACKELSLNLEHQMQQQAWISLLFVKA